MAEHRGGSGNFADNPQKASEAGNDAPSSLRTGFVFLWRFDSFPLCGDRGFMRSDSLDVRL